MSEGNFKKKEKLVVGPRRTPDTRTDWLVDRKLISTSTSGKFRTMLQVKRHISYIASYFFKMHLHIPPLVEWFLEMIPHFHRQYKHFTHISVLSREFYISRPSHNPTFLAPAVEPLTSVGIEVLTVIVTNAAIFWNIMPRTPYLASSRSQAKVKVTLRPTVSRSVRLGVRYPPGTRDQFFPFSLWSFLDSCGFVGVRRPLWRKDWSVNCSEIKQIQCQVTLRPTVSRPVRLGAGPRMGPMTRF
jgi:hypothetical protein